MKRVAGIVAQSSNWHDARAADLVRGYEGADPAELCRSRPDYRPSELLVRSAAALP
jgi:hypothetical protein